MSGLSSEIGQAAGKPSISSYSLALSSQSFNIKQLQYTFMAFWCYIAHMETVGQTLFCTFPTYGTIEVFVPILH